MFCNRLRKNVRRLVPWAARHGIEAYRLYDADIPEVRLLVERFGDHLVVWEYARRAERTEEGAAAQQVFFAEALSALCAETGVSPDHLHVKRRERQRGRMQYQRLAGHAHEHVVREGGHRFRVNLDDFLDTGLFLDHRPTRALVQQVAQGRRVLNLFCYTGSFSVYAAAGGAVQTVSVDLSNTYLAWAERNFIENGLPLSRHRLVQADALALLQDPAGPAQIGGPFDLIVLDPPTFSNSKRMATTLDISRDHPRLVMQALRFLSPDGILLFSCNQQRFVFQPAHLSLPAAYTLCDITRATLPEDIHNPRARTCILIGPTATLRPLVSGASALRQAPIWG